MMRSSDAGVGDVGDLGVVRRVAVTRARDLAADPQLLRLEAQREDEPGVVADPGVRGAA
jgi:hypothetical protein